MKRGVLTIVSLVLIGAMSLVACAPAPTPMPPTSTPAPTVAPMPPTSTPVPTVAPMQSNQPTPAQSAGLALPPIDPAKYSGTIIAAGSSTVYPLAERMAELFQDEGFVGTITIDSIGSGAGFERFCVKGETDISNASRAIKDSEVQSCKSIGRDPIEFQVGIDAMAIVVSNENNFVQTLSMDELRLAFTTAEKWSDINPAWPAEPIKRFIPGTDSGTFDYFVEEVLDKEEEPLLSASNTQMSEDDNVLVQGVQGSPYAIGFFGFAYYQENKAKLRAVAIDGVEPNETTAESGEYPLSRPLFLYSTAKIMKEKPQVAAFINFFLTRVNDEILDVGYFPVSQATLDNAKQRWLDAMGQ
ncbi:MAG: PstS family phosphate ABC transporter substrate-binding protein [Anaerolineae bacterium]